MCGISNRNKTYNKNISDFFQNFANIVECFAFHVNCFQKKKINVHVDLSFSYKDNSVASNESRSFIDTYIMYMKHSLHSFVHDWSTLQSKADLK